MFQLHTNIHMSNVSGQKYEFDVCLSVHLSISVEKKTNYMPLNTLLHL